VIAQSRRIEKLAAVLRATRRLLLLFAFCSTAFAGEQGGDSFVTLYLAQGVDHNLVEMPRVIVRSDIAWEETYLTAAGYFHPLPTPSLVQRAFDTLRAPNTQTGIETVIGKHRGLQDNWEVNAAYFARFAGASVGALRIRPGLGIGLSYAVGTPTYEDGPKDDPERRYHLQNFNTYEFEWSLAAAPRVALVTRIHHRSGVFGLIAPRHVGSNFLAAGIRIGFD
jgi:hypothetical protein